MPENQRPYRETDLMIRYAGVVSDENDLSNFTTEFITELDPLGDTGYFFEVNIIVILHNKNVYRSV